MRLVRKPTTKRTREVRPLAPLTIEQMRAWMLERGRLRHATIISVLAYAGLRPSEMLALAWDAIRGRTLLVERATNDGAIKSTKGTEEAIKTGSAGGRGWESTCSAGRLSAITT